MSGTEKKFNNRKMGYEEINRFRNGDVTLYLTSVDIEGIVRCYGYFVVILKRFICDNLEYNHFEDL